MVCTVLVLHYDVQKRGLKKKNFCRRILSLHSSIFTKKKKKKKKKKTFWSTNENVVLVLCKKYDLLTPRDDDAPLVFFAKGKVVVVVVVVSGIALYALEIARQRRRGDVGKKYSRKYAKTRERTRGEENADRSIVRTIGTDERDGRRRRTDSDEVRE